MDSQIPRTFLQLPGRWGIGGMGDKSAGIKKYKFAVHNSHRDIRYSMGNEGNNIETTMWGMRLVWDLSDWSFSYLYNI